MRKCDRSLLRDTEEIRAFGLSTQIIGDSIDYVYDLIDSIDEKLVLAGSSRLSSLVELANLSAILGNLFRGGITKASEGRFAPNAPHTFPDLLGVGENCQDIEIKIALENNKPKGHLVKPGPHIVLRYVLGQKSGEYERGKETRGDTPWVWEIRVGNLLDSHFNVSNTAGDSGKTAVINAAGMESMPIVYVDLEKAPLSPSGKTAETIRRYMND